MLPKLDDVLVSIAALSTLAKMPLLILKWRSPCATSTNGLRLPSAARRRR